MSTAGLTPEQKKKQKSFLKKASYVRHNVKNKSYKQGKDKEEVFYCTGKDAIECLMNSKWMEKDPKKLELPRTERDEDKFYSRDECIRFCQMMLMNKMFFRGLKVYKEGAKKLEEKKENDEENKKSDNGEEENDSNKQAKKRKYKIDMNRIQGFYDSSDEIFIWMFHPTPFMHWVYGSLVLLLVIGGTLFPLWPSSLRTTVYYGSVSCASFIGGLLVVAFLRTILFGIIWAATGGKHHLWILPNLVEDVGFFESFVPLYTYKVKDGSKKKKKEE